MEPIRNAPEFETSIINGKRYYKWNSFKFPDKKCYILEEEYKLQKAKFFKEAKYKFRHLKGGARGTHCVFPIRYEGDLLPLVYQWYELEKDPDFWKEEAKREF